MRAATVVQVLQDLFYVLLHVLFYLWSLLDSSKINQSINQSIKQQISILQISCHPDLQNNTDQDGKVFASFCCDREQFVFAIFLIMLLNNKLYNSFCEYGRPNIRTANKLLSRIYDAFTAIEQ